MQRTEGGANAAIAQQLWELLAHSPGRIEDTSWRTALPEVRRADEAYAGPAEHAPTGNGRRDPGLRLWECWTTVSRTAREYRA